ncbi:hypothetical protein BU23DRAFT_576528 [Bimuria novae-zelandiae CBS 107.79]|uniref:Zn(2)-C6 fungal-type domain-containing protein n=1 Tax=Bimuria novae-zelandiae CBS 107.79 TaxID=1447943 RepID=A0A6A5W2B7_9PLEO|nr:hypothetical protein BU23DRAFT_576528 [Bimuria novae-zelandiae CBS 107.79]
MSERLVTPRAPVKRQAQDVSEGERSKRGKYTSAACTECKRCKVKCIRLDEGSDCQRCASLGASCIIMQSAARSANEKAKAARQQTNDSADYRQLSDEMRALRQELSTLKEYVASLVANQSGSQLVRRAPRTQYESPIYTGSASERHVEPSEPQFVGPTRASFSINIAENSLSRMGVATDSPKPGDASASTAGSSREASPVPDALQNGHHKYSDCLAEFSDEEVIRLLGIYQDEVVCVHPFIEMDEMIADASRVMEGLRCADRSQTSLSTVDKRDVNMLKLAVATAIMHEAQGRNHLSTKLVESADSVTSVGEGPACLRDMQAMTMLSLYYFHKEEELFAWRTIGVAARQCLEMGLHRKESLMANFPDERARRLATQAFWVVYTLDRRWSFGISLSFALYDRDIDPQLPEPGDDQSYLRCIVAYGRILSKVWEAIPLFRSQNLTIPHETEDYLDFLTQNWLATIPHDLQLRHPRMGLASRTQPRLLHRLRVLLYLRANHMRVLVHRHHVFSTANIEANIGKARVVVDIAQDTISILVHLNETSDIYIRQQSVFHYYLLSSLAIILLAVCHAPASFAEPCRNSFLAAVELVKGFSRHGGASRRLWKTIRGLLPGARSLGLQGSTAVHASSGRSEGVINQAPALAAGYDQVNVPHRGTPPEPVLPQPANSVWTHDLPEFEGDASSSVPDLFNMSSDLLNMFDAFGHPPLNQDLHDNSGVCAVDEQGYSFWDTGEISRRFQGLI